MKRLAICAALLASPVAAQDRMSDAQCAGAGGAIEALAVVPLDAMTFTANDEGWCEIENAVFPFDGGTNWRVDSLRWRAIDIERFVEDGLPPRSLEFIAEGFAVLPLTGDPVLDYLLSVQATPSAMSFGATIRWDGVQNAVLVNDAFFDFYAGNRIEATARIEGVDLTDMATLQMSAGSVGLTDLIVTSDFDGWFEAYVVLGLGTALLVDNGVDPAVQVADMQGQVIEIIEMLPEEILPEGSRLALVEFVTALPNPRGTARLQLDADPGLGTARATPLLLMGQTPSTQQIIDIGLAGVSLLFTWTPKGDAP